MFTREILSTIQWSVIGGMVPEVPLNLNKFKFRRGVYITFLVVEYRTRQRPATKTTYPQSPPSG